MFSLRTSAAAGLAGFLGLILPVALFGFGRAEAPADLQVALYLPSRLVGSPQAHTLAEGLQEARAAGRRAVITVYDGSAGQQRRELTELMDSTDFDLIVTSGQSNAVFCAELLARFPTKRCLVFDAYLPGETGLHTLLFNRHEQAFLAGYLAGRLIQTARRSDQQAGAALIVDEADRQLAAYVALGLHTIDADFTLGLRTNRLSPGDSGFDENLAAMVTELADNGAYMIIAATQPRNSALHAAVRRAGSRLILLDSRPIRRYPVVATITPRFALAARQKLEAALDSRLQYGRAAIIGARDQFLEYHARSFRGAPTAVRHELRALLERLVNSELRLRARL